MLTWEDDVDIHALRRQGWTIAAIARHTGRDRKTVRAYLNGQRAPGVRARGRSDPFAPFIETYIPGAAERGPASVGVTLFDELSRSGSLRDLS